MNKMVKSAARVLDILELFATEPKSLALRDISNRLGIPKSSAHMLLATLEKRAYIVRDEEDRFNISPYATASKSWAGGTHRRMVEAAGPVMRDLVQETKETVVIVAPTANFDVRILAQEVSPLLVRFDFGPEKISPSYCSAMGQVMLAFCSDDDREAYLERADLVALTPHTITDTDKLRQRLQHVRTQGYAVTVEERFDGATGIAVPMFRPGGEVAGATSVGMITARLKNKQASIIVALEVAARRLELATFGTSQGHLSNISREQQV